ncbi:16S rRNA (cytidine(1402)-2'-O)-methyltransferase [Ruminococcus champanellensis]|uniref:Ribosomal RNA small subunit methyltransferase I n=3 Tax=Ruminococcus TaxID=1263 RepID=D4LA32_RUMC1|nr:16S rRNA (cytidine(1402)-2'-O)-methyltransferase [Ruminococcus champanellensis]CBL16477.1 conserved hypothetical protein TIGR00096 [Ruminococcus champanellensis 18P13 = JCM 17042]
MSGMLYIVGTPIGNLGDVTMRQLDTLRTVDFIAAEDTRVTRGLLTHFDIHKPLVSYHDHSGIRCAEGIVERLRAGESAAVVTDAGMPCISDPGEELVRLCWEAGVQVQVVPGPSAAVSALAISGLPTGRFAFEGFLPAAKKQRTARLAELTGEQRTLIFYEAPHRLTATLEDLYQAFGERRIALCRELTKLYEQVLRMTLPEAISYYKEKAPRGEYVLVLEGAAREDAPALTFEEVLEQVRRQVDAGMRAADACKTAAKASGFSKNELYRALLEG